MFYFLSLALALFGCSQGALDVQRMYDYDSLGAHWSIYQKRPLNFTDNPNVEPERNVVLMYSNLAWSKSSPLPAQLFTRVPFPFEAVAIGPNSHIASAAINVKGKLPYILTVGSPIVASFDADTVVSATRLFSQANGGYLELLFYPKAPTLVPQRRANYTRVIVNGASVYTQQTDPDYDPTVGYQFVCDGRRVLSFNAPASASEALFLRFFIGNPFAYDNPSSAVATFLSTPIDDTNIITLANNSKAVVVDVPPGAQMAHIYNAATGLPWAPAQYNYVVSMDD